MPVTIPYFQRGVIQKNSLHDATSGGYVFWKKNLQKSKKINTLDPKIRLKNYPGDGF